MSLIKKIVITLLLIFLFYSLTKNIFDYQKKFRFYQSLKNEVEKISKENVSLKTEMLKKKDLNEVEKTIRNKLNLSQPEETIIVVPLPTVTPFFPSPTLSPVWREWIKVFSPD